MKWLKKFEEVKLKLKKVDAEGNPYTVTDKGLSTSKYRDAAFKLNYYGKKKRSDNLSDWADEKDFGIYNLWMVFRGIYDDDIRVGSQVSDWFKSPKKINKL